MDNAPKRTEEISPTKGSYSVIKKLGQGAFGTASLAVHKDSNWIFVVKEIKDETAMNEIKLFQKLKHKRITKCLGFSGKGDGNEMEFEVYLEYAVNGDLRSRLTKPLQEEETALYTMQILDGIKYLHSKGILHRDLKPDNVLLDLMGDVKLCDFGISRELPTDQNAATFAGTLPYMAPEVFLGNYGKKADIWSLGIMVIEMVTGQRPVRRNALETPIYTVQDVDGLKGFLDDTLAVEEERKSASDLLTSAWMKKWKQENDDAVDIPPYESQLMMYLVRKAASASGLMQQHGEKILHEVFKETAKMKKFEELNNIKKVMEGGEVDSDKLLKDANTLFKTNKLKMTAIFMVMVSADGYLSKNPENVVSKIQSCVQLMKNIFEKVDIQRSDILAVAEELALKARVNGKEDILWECLTNFHIAYCKCVLENYIEALKYADATIYAMEKHKLTTMRLYGKLLNNKGASLCGLNLFREAITSFTNAIEAHKAATDYQSEEDRNTDIERAENNLRNTQAKLN